MPEIRLRLRFMETTSYCILLFLTAYKDLSTSRFALMGDRATLGEAFDVQLDVNLNIGSNGYSSSVSDNYGFRMYLSKMSDRVMPDSEEGKSSGTHVPCSISSLILNAMTITLYQIKAYPRVVPN